MKILFRRALLGVALALAALTLFGAPANAADGAAHVVLAAATVVAFSLDPSLVIQLVVSTVLPLLVGLVTKTVTRPGVKAVLLALFALATSLLVELGASITAGTTYDIGQGLLLALPTFLIAVGLHYGLWKPVGAADTLQAIGTPPRDATVSLELPVASIEDGTPGALVVDESGMVGKVPLGQTPAAGKVTQTNYFATDPERAAQVAAYADEQLRRHSGSI